MELLSPVEEAAGGSDFPAMRLDFDCLRSDFRELRADFRQLQAQMQSQFETTLLAMFLGFQSLVTVVLVALVIATKTA